MISLNDAMQADFKPSLLDLETDSNLYRLQAKADDCIAAWDRLNRAMEPREIVWYNALHRLVESIKKTLLIRYGCND